MKKLLAVILAVVLIASQAAVFANEAEFRYGSEIVMNEVTTKIDDGMGKIVVDKNVNVYVPVRFILEYFGYDVTWSGEDRLVLARNEEGRIIVMQVGSNLLICKEIDGTDNNAEMKKAPYMDKNEWRTYISLDDIMDVLDIGAYELDHDDCKVTLFEKMSEPVTEEAEGEAVEENTEEVTDEAAEEVTEETDAVDEATEENTDEVIEEETEGTAEEAEETVDEAADEK